MTTTLDLRVSTHAVHHEAMRWSELGSEGYFTRLNLRVTDQRKLAAAYLFTAFIAQERGEAYLHGNVRSIGGRLNPGKDDRVHIEVVPSRDHVCIFNESPINPWLLSLGGRETDR